MLQISLFENTLEEKLEKDNASNGKEVLITKLRLGERIDTHLVSIDGVPYIKQQLKKSRHWDKGDRYEEFNKPFINEICRECLSRGFVSELNEGKWCNKHGRPRRFKEKEG